MIKSETASGRGREPAPDRLDARMTRRRHYAGVGLAIVLVAVSVFAIWSSQATSSAVAKAATASRVSDAFARAAGAVGAEESLERKYRLEPGPGVRTLFDNAAADLVGAMEAIRNDGDAADRAVADGVLAAHRGYLDAIDRLFIAVDSGDTAG